MTNESCTIKNLVTHFAAEHGQRDCLQCANEVVTYRDLDEHTDSRLPSLASQGVEKGGGAFMMGHIPPFFEVLLGERGHDVSSCRKRPK